LTSATQKESYRSGYVALVGRPNAGKSTLLNRLLGQKIAAVSDKPQTTRFRIQGVITQPEGQIVLVDTPGVHKPGYEMNRRMMAAVQDALLTVDLVCLICDASVSTGSGDRFVLELVQKTNKPALLLLNKTDKLEDKAALLPLIEWYRHEYEWREVFPISALHGRMSDVLLNGIIKHLPEGEPLFAEDQLTDQPMRTLVAEIIREKIIRHTRQEMPYVTAVLIEEFTETETMTTIHATILVEKDSQKPIIIGAGGARLKEVGTEARLELEKLFPPKVLLKLFVRVEPHWRDDRGLIATLDYRGEGND